MKINLQYFGGNGASSGKSNSSTAGSNKIKSQMLKAGENSKFKGVQRNAKEGKGAFSFKNATAISGKEATKMTNVQFYEKDGNTLAHGLIGEKHVFYASDSGNSIIAKIKDKQESNNAKLAEQNKDYRNNRPEINTTSTYDKWKKKHDKDFAAYYFGGKNV